VDVVIEDTQADNIVPRIPFWYRKVIGARSLLLLPIVLKSRAVGFLYADSDRSTGIRINAEQLDLLRTLRSQVVLAFQHSAAAGRV
jgi:hypothetical protein